MIMPNNVNDDGQFRLGNRDMPEKMIGFWPITNIELSAHCIGNCEGLS